MVDVQDNGGSFQARGETTKQSRLARVRLDDVGLKLVNQPTDPQQRKQVLRLQGSSPHHFGDQDRLEPTRLDMGPHRAFAGPFPPGDQPLIVTR
jgi:hypothetical protein